MQKSGQESYSCKIQHHVVQGDKVTYFILIVNHQNGAVRLLKMRYSEVKNLHDEVTKVVKNYKLLIDLPIFPGRKLFGKTNKDEQTVLNRRQDLQGYLNQLLQINKLHSTELMKNYLPHNIPKPVANSTSNVIITENQDSFFSLDTQAENAFYTKDIDPEQNERFDLLVPQDGGNIRVKIDKYSTIDDVVNYFITLFFMKTKECYTFKSRYSELRSLNDALKDQKFKNKLPSFPKRKLFGITNENTDDINKRREQLEKFLHDLFGVDEFVENEITQYFIQDAKRQADQNRVKEELQILKKKRTKLKLNKSDALQAVKFINEGGTTEQFIKQMEQRQQDIKDGQGKNQQKKGGKRKKKNKDILENITEKQDEINFSEQMSFRNEKIAETIKRMKELVEKEDFNKLVFLSKRQQDDQKIIEQQQTQLEDNQKDIIQNQNLVTNSESVQAIQNSQDKIELTQQLESIKEN